MSAVVSLLTTMDDGSGVEVATVGNEGIVGVPIFLGAHRERGTSQGGEAEHHGEAAASSGAQPLPEIPLPRAALYHHIYHPRHGFAARNAVVRRLTRPRGRHLGAAQAAPRHGARRRRPARENSGSGPKRETGQPQNGC